jgi:hypothetical protein
MATTTLYATKDATVRKWLGGMDNTGGWSGSDKHLAVGTQYDGDRKYRSFVYFPLSFTNMLDITAAVMWLRSDAPNPVGTSRHCDNLLTNTTSIYFDLMTSDWGEGSVLPEGDFSSSQTWTWGNRALSAAYSTIGEAELSFGVGEITGENWFSIDVLPAILRLAPTSIGGEGLPNYGFLMRNEFEEAGNAGRGVQFFSRNKGSGFVPYLVLTHTNNTAPNAPLNITPVDLSVVHTTAPTVSGTFDDGNAGDSMSAAQVQWFSNSGGTTLVWDSGSRAQTGSRFSIAYGGPALAGGNDEWFKARVWDHAGLNGPFSSLIKVTVNSLPNAPTLSLQQTPTSDISTLTPTFKVTHRDPDVVHTTAYGYNIVVEKESSPGSGSWSQVWTTGDVTLVTPVTTVSKTYDGSTALLWATSYRAKAKTSDALGGWGPYCSWVAFSTHRTSTPINLVPTGGQTVGSTTPSVSGNRGSALDSLTKVDLRFWDGASPAIPEMTNVTTGVITTGFSCVPNQTLPTAADLTWQVRAYASLSGWSDWSASQAFKTPGSAALLQTAPIGSGITDLTPDISFQCTTAFNFHDIQVRRKSDLVSMWAPGGLTSGGSVTSKTVTYAGTALAWSIAYQWRVRVSSDGGTVWTGWTGWQDFTTDEADVASITSPSADAWLTDTTPTITGTTPSTMQAFRIVVWPTSGLSGQMTYDSGWLSDADTSFSHALTSALERGKDYWVQAQYQKSTGPIGGFCPARHIHINALPSVPVGIWPPSNMVIPDDLTPDLKATFTDADLLNWGDYPSKWRIEVIRESDSNTMLAAEYTTGLVIGENVKTYAGTALSYQIWYQARHKFWDSLDEGGSFSTYFRFRTGRAGTTGITAYTDNEVNNPSFTVQWSWDHPDAHLQARFHLWMSRDIDGQTVYDAGIQESGVHSHFVPAGYVQNTRYYTLHLVAYDTDLIPSTEETYSILATWAAPDGVQDVSTTYDDVHSWLVVEWTPVTDPNFDYYQLYRKERSDSLWRAYATVNVRSTGSFTDYRAGHGVTYEYYVTWFRKVSGDQSMESGVSEIATGNIDADRWTLIGSDRSDDHTFELPVVDEQHQPVIQQETFEPLGSQRKKVVRGLVLGEEGWLECFWASDERTVAKQYVSYLTNDHGPHLLKSPFGDVWEAAFAAPTKRYRQAGAYGVRLEWIEVVVP